MIPATTEILERGIDCLVKNLGIVEAEAFIAAVQREKFDYTKWHQNVFAEDMTLEEINAAAVEYRKAHS